MSTDSVWSQSTRNRNGTVWRRVYSCTISCIRSDTAQNRHSPDRLQRALHQAVVVSAPQSDCHQLELSSTLVRSWRREWLPTAAFLPGEFHGQRGLAGYSPWGHRESDMTERISLSLVHSNAWITTHALLLEICSYIKSLRVYLGFFTRPISVLIFCSCSCDTWGPRSPTRDWTRTPCTGPPRESLDPFMNLVFY